jgi:hypothetical protein
MRNTILALLILLCPAMLCATDGSIAVRVISSQSLTAGVVAGTASINHDNSDVFTDGAGAAQIQVIYSADVTGTTTAGTDYDLVGGLRDAFGRTLTFTSVRAIYVEAAAANTGNILLGAGTHPITGWVANTSDIVTVRPGGAFCLVAMDSTGYTVTATSADDLGVKASTGTVNYKIVVWGTGTAAY